MMCNTAIFDGKFRSWKIEDGHLLVYEDPYRINGGFWRHRCEEGLCGKYRENEISPDSLFCTMLERDGV